jgi:hypothetical protein
LEGQGERREVKGRTGERGWNLIRNWIPVGKEDG